MFYALHEIESSDNIGVKKCDNSDLLEKSETLFNIGLGKCDNSDLLEKSETLFNLRVYSHDFGMFTTKSSLYISVGALLIDIFHRANIPDKVLNYTLEVIIGGKFVSFYDFDLRSEVSVLFNDLNSNLLQVHVISFADIHVKQESLSKLLTFCHNWQGINLIDGYYHILGIIYQYFSIYLPLNNDRPPVKRCLMPELMMV